MVRKSRYAPPSRRRSGSAALSPAAKGYCAALPLVLSDPRRRADAFSDEHTVFEQWCAGQNVWIGASLPGPLTAERLRQAGRALQIARLDGQSRTAFYSEAMTNDQLLKQNNPVLWAVSYVQSDPGRPVHLRELCAQMHLNYSYFSRQFHQQTGKTFTDYVQGVQMQ